jgi:hypothetical protein
VKARPWLNARGLKDETIEECKLGLNPQKSFPSRESWGLETVIKEETGKPKKLWLPRGIVIPCYRRGELVRLRIRRPVDDPKYYIVPGSANTPMLLGHGQRSLVIVESELDAMLVYQEAGDLIDVIALGSAQVRPDKQTQNHLLRYELMLIALDTDEAGAKESWGWWDKHYSQAKRWPIVLGKDPGEAYGKGLDIRMWIEAGLNKEPEYAEQRPSVETGGSKPESEVGNEEGVYYSEAHQQSREQCYACGSTRFWK